MQGLKRKVFHACLFEAMALGIVTSAGVWLGLGDSAHSAGLAVMTSLLAMGWNMVFNTWFERWERRHPLGPAGGRNLVRRVAHAIGFEGGLTVLTVPVIAWWLELGWWDALMVDLSLVVFFLFYTFVFNWGFDQVFGLPDSV